MKRMSRRNATGPWVAGALGLMLVASAAGAATPLDELRVSPETTVDLSGTFARHGDVGSDDLSGTVTLLGLGGLPLEADLDGYHQLLGGDQLFSLDVEATLAGGLTVEDADVVRWDGAVYTLEFDASAEGLPRSVDVDAVATELEIVGNALVDGDLLLSFDVDTAVDGITVADEDLVRFDGSSFFVFFDGSAAGLPGGVDVDGADFLQNGGNLLLSFDVTVTVGGITAADEDVVEYDAGAGTWELAYDGSAEHSGWSDSGLDALAAGPRCPTAELLPTMLARAYCSNDPTITCSSSADCGAGSCLKGAYTWSSSQPVRNASGTFTSSAEIGTYNANRFLGSIGTADEFLDAPTPAAGAGFWYLVKPDCDAPVATWQTTPGAEPGRDAVLP